MSTKQVTLTLTDEEAEEILIALSFRSKQIGQVSQRIGEIDATGHKLSAAFEQAFGWMAGIYGCHLENPVRIKVLKA